MSSPSAAPTHAAVQEPARPATAQSTQQQQPQPTQPQPTAIPTTTTRDDTTTPTNPATEPHKTLYDHLNAGDTHWQWKMGLRAALVLTGLIGIACAAWTMTHYGARSSAYKYVLDDSWTMQWTLMTFAPTVAWSAACILVFVARRAHTPMHPGAQVGVDLVLWLGYIPTVLLAQVAVMSVAAMGADGTLGGDSMYSSARDGLYLYQPATGTWVWNATSGAYDAGARACNESSSSVSGGYYYGFGRSFADCADEDAYVNALWRGKSTRFSTELAATVCQFLALFLHITLFVWACVDTHRRRSRRVGKDAEKLAAEIVMKMVQAGAVVPPPAAARPGQMPYPPYVQHGHVPPHMMQHMFPQQFPQQTMPPQHPHYGHFAPQQQQPPHPHPQPPMSNVPGPAQPVVASGSGSNEKAAGSRFA